MRILLSNDDGYFAPGLAALAEGLAPLGEITVVAPERDRSGASNSLTLDRPLHAAPRAQRLLYVNGTPTDCVHMAVTGMLDFEPDVVVSGINSGSNMGDDTLYSGTVAAATEGYLLGIPSIAVSLVGKEFEHFATAARVARDLVERLARAPFGAPVLLNVNVPDVPYEPLTGMRGHAPRAAATRRSPWCRARTRAARRCTGSGPPAPRARRARAPISTRSSAARSRSRRCRWTSRTPAQIPLVGEWMAKP